MYFLLLVSNAQTQPRVPSARRPIPRRKYSLFMRQTFLQKITFIIFLQKKIFSSNHA